MSNTTEELIFDLTLTDDQRMSRDTMQRFAAQEIREIAQAVDKGESASEVFYAKTAELGLTLLPIPEALGGAGMERSPVSNVLIYEDLACGDMALALGSIAPLGFVNTLLDQGSDDRLGDFSFELLRRHVLEGPQDHPGGSERRGEGRCAGEIRR